MSFELVKRSEAPVYSTDDYIVHKWSDGGVHFSATSRGSAIQCHLHSEKNSVRKLKSAIEDYEKFIFCKYDFCKMIIVTVNLRSIMKLLERCGFERIHDTFIYVRLRQWVL
jgi:hypothetical protein